MVLTTLCFAVCFNSSAQRVAGYMGKRTFVGASVIYIPNVFSFGNAAASIDYNSNRKFYMRNSLKYGLSAGYTLSNDKSLVVDLDYQRMGLVDDGASELSRYYTKDEFTYARSIALGLKVKIQKAVQICAPIGSYQGISFGLHRYQNSALNAQNNVIVFSPVYDASVGFTGGVRRVFKDKFMIDLGIDFNLHLRLFGAILMDESDIEKIARKYSIRKNGFNNTVSSKLAFYYLL